MFFFVSCHKNSTEPNDEDKKEKTLSYNVSQLSNEYIPLLLIASNLIYPDSTRNWYIPDEIVVSLNEQYKVELNNCPINQAWTYEIEDQAMKLIRCDTLLNDSTMNLTYSFSASEACKGCLLFLNNNLSSQRRLVVQYTCSPLSSIVFNLTHQDWLVDTTGFSVLRIYLAGQTNVQKLKVETYGDGLVGAVSIYPKNDGSFSDTISIAFSYVSGVVLNNNTRIALYGAIGFPKIINIINPNNH
jgi:hypothetical protein